MSRFREGLKENESGKKNPKMSQKHKKKEAENKVWLFHKNYSKWIENTSEYAEKYRIYNLNSHNYVCGFTIQDNAVISKDRLPLIGSSRNKSAGTIIVYM